MDCGYFEWDEGDDGRGKEDSGGWDVRRMDSHKKTSIARSQ